jgi:hydrogenase maturation protease
MKTAVIGIGNILFMDEGVGVYAAKYLERNYAIDADIVDGGTLGFKLMRYYQEYDKVIIIDTVSIEDDPGSIYNLPSDVLLGLGICSLLENHAKVNIVGIVPADIESVAIDLTPTLKSRFDALVAEVLAELRRDGVAYEKRGDESLESIIAAYANPSAKELLWS